MQKQRIFVSIVILLILLIPNYSILQEQEQLKSPKPIELQDILDWKNIRNTQISNDGKWFSYVLVPNEGDGDVLVRQTDGDKEHKFSIGKNSGATDFSADSKWFAFTISPDTKESEQAKKSKKKLYNKIGLLNLTSGEKIEFDKVRRFSFSRENPDWILFQKYGGENSGKEKDKASGADLILHELSTKKQFNFGNVSEFAFNKTGRWLAWFIDAEDKSGNGVYLRDMKTGLIQALDNDSAVYKGLNWTEKGDAFAVLKGKTDKKFEDKIYCLVGFKNLDVKNPTKVSFNPEDDKEFPDKMTISPYREPFWTEDLSGILFGIHELKEKEDAKKDEDKNDKEIDEKDSTGAKSEIKDAPQDTTSKSKPEKPIKVEKDELPGLVIWHWKDKRLQSMQQVQENFDKNYSYLCIFHVKEKKFTRLADEELRDVFVAPKEKWAIGLDDQEYELLGNLEGRRYQDIYIIDLKTGDRKLALTKNRWFFGPSPDGTHFLYYDNVHYYTYEMASGKAFNITKDVPASFIDAENDLNVIDPPIRPIGWVKDGVSVLLSDNWDVWNIPVHGGKGMNLSVNGKRESIRYQRRFRLDPDEKGIDLSKPVYFTTYGEWTKKAGIARIDKGKPGAKMLQWDDASFSDLMKAKNAEIYLFSRSTFKDYPDHLVADASLQNSKILSDANPQQKDFAWSSGVRLIDYESDKGDKLQAALFLPANYEEGKSYPTIVYIYEKLSQNLNRYFTPSARGFNKSVYNSNGYAVLMPDIVYKINDPGMSSVWCVLPAIKAAIETGIVDENNIAIHGHSWGGYQTAFLVTQTDLFKAAIAGAPLTNMISMYSSVYWNSGSANQPIFESSQGRFFGGYWENIEAYTRNSPVYFAEKVKTPMIILHNDKDGAVDWNQGIEYFNTLRRLGKPVVMLQYKGENHGLRQPENQKDYTIRMKEFFDHYLKGAPAPQWLDEGIAHLKLEDHLENRVREMKKEKAERDKAAKELEKKAKETVKEDKK